MTSAAMQHPGHPRLLFLSLQQLGIWNRQGSTASSILAESQIPRSPHAHRPSHHGRHVSTA